MNCAEIEALICEYVDGTLSPADRAVVERHLSGCPACAELARDSAAAVAFMSRAADVEPPPELVTKILFDRPWAKARRNQGWFAKLVSPILQPKLAMGMAMTILSLSMLSRFVAPVRQLKPSDLRPAEIWTGLESRVNRAWARSVKFYENLKFVYQIQTTLHEWQQQSEDQKAPAEKTDDRKLPVKNNPGKGSTNAPGGAPETNPPVSH